MSAQPKNVSRSSLLLGSLLLALAVQPAHAKILNPPYLQAVSMTGVCVMVECDTTNAASVAYGPTPSYGRTATTGFYLTTSITTFVHRVWLTGLEPNSTCHYRASHGDDQSADANFQTAPPSGTPFRFAFMADFQSTSTNHDVMVSQLIETHHPRLCVYGGDMPFNGRKYDLWKKHFLDKQRLLIARVPFFGAVGNHDGWVENTQAFLQAPDSGSHTQAYYSVDYSDVHFLILNTELSCDINSPQYAFAQADLAACTQKWKVVVFHKSAYVGGGHGEHADMKTMTSNVFEPNGVDLCLTGHHHFYQHNLVNGIHHMVIGPANTIIRGPGTAPYTVKSAMGSNYSVIDVTPSTLTLKVYGVQGELWDTVKLKKDAASADSVDAKGDSAAELAVPVSAAPSSP